MFRKLMTAATTLALVSSAAAAQTYTSVHVTGATVYGALPATTPVSKISGFYTEKFSGMSDLVGSGGTFSSSLLWQANEFLSDSNTGGPASQLGGMAGNQYSLYALYHANGTYSQPAGSALFEFTQGGSFVMFLDANLDTVFASPVDDFSGWRTFNSTDDRVIADGDAIYCGVSCGSFSMSPAFTLTTFTLTNPSGEQSTFRSSWSQVINGSLDVTFVNAVPEPSSIFLVGLGLLGFATSRRKSVKNRNA